LLLDLHGLCKWAEIQADHSFFQLLFGGGNNVGGIDKIAGHDVCH
jgi:hypothetical protein